MKKILATLLVASMLLSCVSVISFAAGSVETIASFPYAAMGTIEDEEFADAVGAAYYDAFRDVTGLGKSAAKGTPIYGALFAAEDDAESVEVPEVVTPADIVLVPVIAGGDGIDAFGADIIYDTNYFEGVIGEDFGTQNINTPGKLELSWFSAKAVKGLVGALYLKVKEGATGDADGKANTTVTISVKKAEVNATPVSVGNMSIAIALEGLEKGATVEKDEATAEDVSDVTAFTGSSDDYQASFDAIKDKVVPGDGVEYVYEKYGVYQIYFATAVADTLKTPDEQGIMFKINDNAPVYKAANAEHVKDGKFGILIFGMGAQSTVEAKAYAKYGTEYVLAD